MPALLWPDGTFHRAPTWDDLLESLREHPWNAGYSKTSFRHALAKRAYIWSLTVVDAEADTAEFVQQLHDAGLVRIIEITERRTG